MLACDIFLSFFLPFFYFHDLLPTYLSVLLSLAFLRLFSGGRKRKRGSKPAKETNFVKRTFGCDSLWTLKLDGCLGLIVLYIQHEYLCMWKTTYLFPVLVSFHFPVKLSVMLNQCDLLTHPPTRYVYKTSPKFRLVWCKTLHLVIGNLIQNIRTDFLAPCYH